MKGNLKKSIQGNGGKLLLAFSALIYLLSFFMPSYSTRLSLYGYECAYLAFAMVFDSNDNINGGFLILCLTKGHFFLMGLHNIIVPVCLMFYKKIAAEYFQWLLNILAISIVNAILFFFYNYFDGQVANETLLPGYYIWMFSSVFIYVLLKWKVMCTSVDNT